jgi:hypothetical protein
MASMVLALMVIAVLRGALPLQAGVNGAQTMKATIGSASGRLQLRFTGFSTTWPRQDVAGLRLEMDDLKVWGLCASIKVPTPLGQVVTRFSSVGDSTSVDIGSFALGVKELKFVGLRMRHSSVNPLVAPDQRPLSQLDFTQLPFSAQGIRVHLGATLSYLTVDDIRSLNVKIDSGLHVRECF